MAAPEFEQDAGHVVALQASPEQMTGYLKPGAFKSASVLAGFYWQLAQRDRQTALRGLEGVLSAPRTGWNTRENAYSLYVDFARGEQLETMCLRCLNDFDPKLREYAAQEVHRIADPALKQKMILAALSHSNQKVRVAFVSGWLNMRMFIDDPEISRETFAVFASVLSGSDIYLRRTTVWYANWSLGETPVDTPYFDDGIGGTSVAAGGTPVPETAAELKELEKAKEQIADWQRKREQKKPKAK